jgi:hypothetical protein
MISHILSEVAAAGAPELVAYAMGALRDGTFNRRHRTWRVAQAHVAWLEIIQEVLVCLGAKSWTYQEGSRRRSGFLKHVFDPMA